MCAHVCVCVSQVRARPPSTAGGGRSRARSHSYSSGTERYVSLYVVRVCVWATACSPPRVSQQSIFLRYSNPTRKCFILPTRAVLLCAHKRRYSLRAVETGKFVDATDNEDDDDHDAGGGAGDGGGGGSGFDGDPDALDRTVTPGSSIGLGVARPEAVLGELVETCYRTTCCQR